MAAMRKIVLAFALMLLASVPANAASLCLVTRSVSTGLVADAFDMEVTGSAGGMFTLAMFERTLSRATLGTATLVGNTLYLGAVKNGSTVVTGYNCTIDVTTLAGTCKQHNIFPEPASGTSDSFTRNVSLSAQSCASLGLHPASEPAEGE